MIDGHVHAFPDVTWGRSWQSEAGFEPERDGTLRDLVARMDSASIEAAVLLLFARPGRRGREEAAAAVRALNRWGLDAAGRDPRLLPFIGVDPNALSPDEVVAEILAHPQTEALGLVQSVEHPTAGRIPQLGPPLEMSDTPAAIRRAPPLLGEHTREVLADYGFAPEEVDRLVTEGIAGPAS